MLEVAIGQPWEAEYSARYMKSIRSVDFRSLFPSKGVRWIGELIDDSVIDRELFREATDFLLEEIRSYYCDSFNFLPFDKWGVTKTNQNDVGGFHSAASIGYLDNYRVGLCAEPNKIIYGGIKHITLEVLRCYVHDSIHSCTFRSFRLSSYEKGQDKKSKNFVPAPYRYQYGISFRQQNGVSFSPPTAKENSINLNLLMDGIGVITQIKCMKKFLHLNKFASIDFGNIFIRDILGQCHPGETGYTFYKRVIVPSEWFLSKYNLQNSIKIVGNACYTGDRGELEKHLCTILKNSSAWDDLFRQKWFVYEHHENDVCIEIC